MTDRRYQWCLYQRHGHWAKYILWAAFCKQDMISALQIQVEKVPQGSSHGWRFLVFSKGVSLEKTLYTDIIIFLSSCQRPRRENLRSHQQMTCLPVLRSQPVPGGEPSFSWLTALGRSCLAVTSKLISAVLLSFQPEIPFSYKETWHKKLVSAAW